MTVDFAALLYDSLPGLYRDQDTRGELRAFLQVAAGPLAEVYASIGALHDDLYAATCRPELITLVGALIGAEVDAGAPEREQRAQVLDSIRAYRQKGTADEVLRRAEQLTGWRVHAVDGSTRLARLALVEDPGPQDRRPATMPIGDLGMIGRIGRVDDDVAYTVDVGSPRRVSDREGRAHPDAHVLFCTPALVVAGQRPARLADGSGGFTFADRDRGPITLLDGFDARPLTRAALAAEPAAFAGTPRGFTFRVRGADTAAPVLAADLSDPAAPRDLAGAPLTRSGTEVAVDPQTGRFLADPAALGARAGEFTVDYLLAAAPDPAADAQTFADLAAGLTRVLPAAAVAVVTDTRRRRIDPAVLASADQGAT